MGNVRLFTQLLGFKILHYGHALVAGDFSRPGSTIV
jgi:hypothetical protein